MGPDEMLLPQAADASILSIADSHTCLRCYDDFYNL